MEEIIQKHPLDIDHQLSIAYTIAFGKPTSKFEIQKYLTKSHRHTTIIEKYNNFFTLSERTDKRFGKQIKSKPEVIVELIKNKIFIDTITQSNLEKLLSNKLIESQINKGIDKKIKIGYKPINHYLILEEIALLFMGKYTRDEYFKFFQPKKSQKEFLLKYNKLDKEFLPKLHNKDKPKKPSKDSIEMVKVLNQFNFDIIKKLIYLIPYHEILLRVYKAGVLWAESCK